MRNLIWQALGLAVAAALFALLALIPKDAQVSSGLQMLAAVAVVGCVGMVIAMTLDWRRRRTLP